jgi:hypothetical protein
MVLSERHQKQLDTFNLVECLTQSVGTTSWVWGGYVTDICMGRILRDHDDVDYLTLNLHALLSEIMEAFSNRGWQTKVLVNGDLSLKKEGVKVHLGNLEFGELARWTHNGEQGALLFPLSWLSPDVIKFYGMGIHVVAPELQYVLKEHPELLNPDWLLREKDRHDKEYLRDILMQKGTEICSLYQLVIRV